MASQPDLLSRAQSTILFVASPQWHPAAEHHGDHHLRLPEQELLLPCTRASLTGGVVLDRRQHHCPACVLDLLPPRPIKFREPPLFCFCCSISGRLQATTPGVCDACCCRCFLSLSTNEQRLQGFSPSSFP
ncbi:hypothetical protein CFC21_064548 [Triticum aestivum]|uniref:Uncharacterized protein n=3 Tax=Triticum TaxID=4564 RepID=A0A9R0THF2_TRITD|nr:hypothetical protein CFC21_064548 [Triticum aestivum]VAI13839.1 unnamed protein product [Triticum turgidum subsp. durum]